MARFCAVTLFWRLYFQVWTARGSKKRRSLVGWIWRKIRRQQAVRPCTACRLTVAPEGRVVRYTWGVWQTYRDGTPTVRMLHSCSWPNTAKAPCLSGRLSSYRSIVFGRSIHKRGVFIFLVVLENGPISWPLRLALSILLQSKTVPRSWVGLPIPGRHMSRLRSDSSGYSTAAFSMNSSVCPDR